MAGAASAAINVFDATGNVVNATGEIVVAAADSEAAKAALNAAGNAVDDAGNIVDSAGNVVVDAANSAAVRSAMSSAVGALSAAGNVVVDVVETGISAAPAGIVPDMSAAARRAMQSNVGCDVEAFLSGGAEGMKEVMGSAATWAAPAADSIYALNAKDVAALTSKVAGIAVQFYDTMLVEVARDFYQVCRWHETTALPLITGVQRGDPYVLRRNLYDRQVMGLVFGSFIALAGDVFGKIYACVCAAFRFLFVAYQGRINGTPHIQRTGVVKKVSRATNG